MINKELRECPHCHSKEGYYIKYQYSGSGIFRFNFYQTNSEEKHTVNNDDMYDGLLSKESKYCYCLNCNKRICKTDEVRK